MKYKLLKKIDGVDWEVGKVLENKEGCYDSLLDKMLSDPIIIHNLLLNGTIEKVEKNKIWRAEAGGVYYYIGGYCDVYDTRDYSIAADNNYYNSGNYFRTREQAQEVAHKIKQILKESHERN